MPSKEIHLPFYLLKDLTAEEAERQMSSVTSAPPTQREPRQVMVQLMTSRSRGAVSRGVESLQRRTTRSSEMYVSQAPGGTTGRRQPNTAWCAFTVNSLQYYHNDQSEQHQGVLSRAAAVNAGGEAALVILLYIKV